jgi:hypothetical protein
MPNYNFHESMAIGKIAVDAVSALLIRQPIHQHLRSVEDIEVFQNAGVDLLWYVTDGEKVRQVKIEVKADTYFETGNIFLETESNTTKGTPGCFVGSCADIYAYFFVGANVLYWIPLKLAQKWLIESQGRFPERYTSTGNGSKHFYRTKGVLVPRLTLLQEVYGTKEIKIGG